MTSEELIPSVDQNRNVKAEALNTLGEQLKLRRSLVLTRIAGISKYLTKWQLFHW